jgi:protein SCO1/2
MHGHHTGCDLHSTYIIHFFEKCQIFNDIYDVGGLKADIGGPWMLYDTDGNVMTHKNLEGKYYLIYFGFTLCPDVCPISLNKTSKAKRIVQKSKEYQYFDLESIFVSLDPDRDTNERIRQY